MSAILYNGSLFCIDIMCQYPSVMARIKEHLVCIDYNKHLHYRIYLTCTLIHIIQSQYLTCHWIITHSKPQSCLKKWCYISLDCLSKLVDSAAEKWSSHAIIHHWRRIWYVYLIRLLLIYHCNSVQLYVFDLEQCCFKWLANTMMCSVLLSVANHIPPWIYLKNKQENAALHSMKL